MSDHPPWCVNHDDAGRCLGELDGPGPVEDRYHVYARPTKNPDGSLGVEVVTSQDGGEIVRVNVTLEVQ